MEYHSAHTSPLLELDVDSVRDNGDVAVLLHAGWSAGAWVPADSVVAVDGVLLSELGIATGADLNHHLEARLEGGAHLPPPRITVAREGDSSLDKQACASSRRQ